MGLTHDIVQSRSGAVYLRVALDHGDHQHAVQERLTPSAGDLSGWGGEDGRARASAAVRAATATLRTAVGRCRG